MLYCFLLLFFSRRHFGNIPPFIFFGNAYSCSGIRCNFQCFGNCTASAYRLRAYHNYQLSKSTKWIKAYKWPIYCFIAMCFWNFLGAGIFGFAINPPIALYYIQGLNTTAVHGHAALFGVYGILGIGLMMFMLRGLYPERQWNDKLIGWAFWLTNIGLLVMVTISLLPIGIMQSVASIKEGYWYARSAEFMQTDIMHFLRWMRVPGDILLALGELLLVIFIIGLKFGWSLKEKR